MVVIRQATFDDAHAFGLVHAETWRMAYRGIVPDDFLDAIDPVRWGEQQRPHMLTPPPVY